MELKLDLALMELPMKSIKCKWIDFQVKGKKNLFKLISFQQCTPTTKVKQASWDINRSILTNEGTIHRTEVKGKVQQLV